MRFFLPRTVIVLGVVSTLNDIASEMVIPLLPVLLTTVLGAGPAIVGLIEGIADATASLVKLYAGVLLDRGTGAKKLILQGYGLSNVARPLIGVAAAWTLVMMLRFIDRIGKGLRTAPRDVLIATAVAPGLRGRAFGFQRAMDHTGAIIGPSLAFVLLAYGTSYEVLFLVSAVPGVLLMGLLVLGLPRQGQDFSPPPPPRFHWQVLPSPIKSLVKISAWATAVAMPDAFLVLWLMSQGVATHWIPLWWAAAHGLRVLMSGLGGWWADRRGAVTVVRYGWLARVVFLLALAVLSTKTDTWTSVVLLGYAGVSAVTEAAERAYLGILAPAEHRGTVYGVYHLVNGLAVLPGALLFGLLWQYIGVPATLLCAALATLGASIAFWNAVRPSSAAPHID